MLKNIPFTSTPETSLLKKLNCSYCPLLLYNKKSIIDNIEFIECFGCKWINKNNVEYEYNINKLIILQKWFKRIITSKRLKKLIPKLMPLYYDPESKGGYFHKKKMFVFIEKIN